MQLLAVEITIAVIGIFLAYRCITFGNNDMRDFSNLVVILNVFLLVNIPVRCAELHLVQWNRTVVFWLYAVSVLAMTSLAAQWCIYLLKLINSPLVSSLNRIILFSVPGILMIPLCIANQYTGWLYTIDEYSYYSRGSIFVLQAAVSYFYMTIVVVSSIVHVIRQKDRSFSIKTGWIVVPTVLCAFMQIQYGGSFFAAGAAICGLITYVEITVENQQNAEIQKLENEARINEEHAREMRKLFNESAETLAGTIDAKDRYTNGHSVRVAKYVRMIGGLLGYSEDVCRELYLCGLLHDIGKISIADEIINKPGRLSDEEFVEIKNHPMYGAHILETMKTAPYLTDGAKYHHERYDGKGYPSGIGGTEIPLYARIIAVADAYDAMTSRRSYRTIMDQVEVKQEIWKGMGTQFDPLFAKCMIALIDADSDYEMSQRADHEVIQTDAVSESVKWNTEPPKAIKQEMNTAMEMDFSTLAAFVLTEEHWVTPEHYVKVGEQSSAVRFISRTRSDAKYIWNTPAIIVFSSKDGRIMGPGYDEMAVYMSAGYSWKAGSSVEEKMEITRKSNDFKFWDIWTTRNMEGMEYTVSTYRDARFVYITMETELTEFKGTVELAGKYLNGKGTIYLAITGDTCDIVSFSV